MDLDFKIGCVICGDLLAQTFRKRQEKDLLDDQLSVVFFLKTFFKYPVLLPSFEPSDGFDIEDILVQTLENDGRNPSEWISFCTHCSRGIRSARKLYKQLVRLESELNEIRHKIERKILQTFHKDSSKGNEGTKDIRRSVREAIYQQCSTSKEEDVGVNIKVEADLEEEYTLGAPGDAFLEMPKLEDFVIDPEKDVSSREGFGSSDEDNQDHTKEIKDLDLPVVEDEDEAFSDFIGDDNLEHSSSDEEYKPSSSKKSLGVGRKSIVKSSQGKKVSKQENGQKRPKKKLTVEHKTCPVCRRVFVSQIRMRDHLNAVHEKNVLFKCEVCGKGFYRKCSYRIHVKCHLSVEDQEKLELAKELHEKKYLPEVKSLQEGDDGLNEEAFLAELGENISKKDLNDLLARTCPVCRQPFYNATRMQYHLKAVHTEANAYVCDICGKSFGWKNTFQAHVKFHNEKRPHPHPCLVEGCGKRFQSQKDLNRHSVVHTGKKEHLCSLCGGSFTQSQGLQRHMMNKHMDSPKTHACHICPKTFLHKDHLSQHLKSKSHGGPGIQNSRKRKLKKSKCKPEEMSTANSEEIPAASISLSSMPYVTYNKI